MFHKLLEEQIQKYLNGEMPSDDPKFVQFLQEVSSVYQQYDKSKLDLEINSDELSVAKEKLAGVAEKDKRLLEQLVEFCQRVSGRGQIQLEKNEISEVLSLVEAQLSERKFFEDRLRENQSNLRALIENTSDTIWSVDKDLNLMVFNEKISQIPFVKQGQKPVVHQGLYDLFDARYLKEMVRLHKRGLEGERFDSYLETQVQGEPCRWHLFFNPIMSGSEQLGVAIFARDVTNLSKEQEKVVQELMTAKMENRAKSQFLANMSHELRTPLNTIKGYTEILLEEISEKKQIEDLNKIKSASDHLLMIIEEILDITLIETGKANLYIKLFSVMALVEEIKEFSTRVMEKGENRFVVKVDPKIGMMESDMMKLRQILMNLLSNSAKYTSCGTITLKVYEKDEEHLVFEIEDEGAGISPEKMVHLFDSYTPISENKENKVEGFGMGLSITHRYTELLGGVIRVKSEVGKGTTISVELPRQHQTVGQVQ